MAKKAETSIEPDRTAEQHENEGLAGRLLELKATVEGHRKLAVRDHAELKAEFGRMTERMKTLDGKIDGAMNEWARRSRELDQTQRDSAEHVRAAGQIAREMKDRVQVLDELRETSADPHAVVKPLQREVAQLKADLSALGQRIDVKFDALPRQKPAPAEFRGDTTRRRDPSSAA
jgi:chromosome segregation ATPase